MYRCEICNTNVQERYRKKHNQSRKHKSYSNLMLNRHVQKDVQVVKFKDAFNTYLTKHLKNQFFHSVYILKISRR